METALAPAEIRDTQPLPVIGTADLTAVKGIVTKSPLIQGLFEDRRTQLETSTEAPGQQTEEMARLQRILGPEDLQREDAEFAKEIIQEKISELKAAKESRNRRKSSSPGTGNNAIKQFEAAEFNIGKLLSQEALTQSQKESPVIRRITDKLPISHEQIASLEEELLQQLGTATNTAAENEEVTESTDSTGETNESGESEERVADIDNDWLATLRKQAETNRREGHLPAPNEPLPDREPVTGDLGTENQEQTDQQDTSGLTTEGQATDTGELTTEDQTTDTGTLTIEDQRADTNQQKAPDVTESIRELPVVPVDQPNGDSTDITQAIQPHSRATTEQAEEKDDSELVDKEQMREYHLGNFTSQIENKGIRWKTFAEYKKWKEAEGRLEAGKGAEASVTKPAAEIPHPQPAPAAAETTQPLQEAVSNESLHQSNEQRLNQSTIELTQTQEPLRIPFTEQYIDLSLSPLEAFQEYAARLDKNPNDGVACAGLASACVNLAREAEAQVEQVLAMQRAAEINEQQALVMQNYDEASRQQVLAGQMRDEVPKQQIIARQMYERALQACQVGIAVTSREEMRMYGEVYSSLYFSQALALMADGRPRNAIKSLESAALLKGRYTVDYYIAEANALRTLDTKEAVHVWEKATYLEPRNFRLYVGMAEALLDEGRSEEALAAYDQAIALSGGYPQVLQLKQQLLVELLDQYPLWQGLQHSQGDFALKMDRATKQMAAYESALDKSHGKKNQKISNQIRDLEIAVGREQEYFSLRDRIDRAYSQAHYFPGMEEHSAVTEELPLGKIDEWYREQHRALGEDANLPSYHELPLPIDGPGAMTQLDLQALPLTLGEEVQRLSARYVWKAVRVYKDVVKLVKKIDIPMTEVPLAARNITVKKINEIAEKIDYSLNHMDSITSSIRQNDPNADVPELVYSFLNILGKLPTVDLSEKGLKPTLEKAGKALQKELHKMVLGVIWSERHSSLDQTRMLPVIASSSELHATARLENPITSVVSPVNLRQETQPVAPESQPISIHSQQWYDQEVDDTPPLQSSSPSTENLPGEASPVAPLSQKKLLSTEELLADVLSKLPEPLRADYLEQSKNPYKVPDKLRDLVSGIMGTASNHLHLRDYDLALVCFEEVLRIDPKNIDAMLALAEVYHSKGEKGEARRRYKAVFELDSNNTEFGMQAVDGLYHLGELDEALSLSERVLQINSMEGEEIHGDRTSLLMTMEIKGDILYKQGNISGAIDAYEDLLGRAPGDVGVRMRLATALYRLYSLNDNEVDKADAIREYRQAQQLIFSQTDTPVMNMAYVGSYTGDPEMIRQREESIALEYIPVGRVDPAKNKSEYERNLLWARNVIDNHNLNHKSDNQWTITPEQYVSRVLSTPEIKYATNQKGHIQRVQSYMNTLTDEIIENNLRLDLQTEENKRLGIEPPPLVELRQKNAEPSTEPLSDGLSDVTAVQRIISNTEVEQRLSNEYASILAKNRNVSV